MSNIFYVIEKNNNDMVYHFIKFAVKIFQKYYFEVTVKRTKYEQFTCI